jgi:hypothetical protein
MFVTTAIAPATLLVSAQIRPMIVPTTSTATAAASQYRIRRLVMVASLLSLPPHRLPRFRGTALRRRLALPKPIAGRVQHPQEERAIVRGKASAKNQGTILVPGVTRVGGVLKRTRRVRGHPAVRADRFNNSHVARLANGSDSVGGAMLQHKT